MLANANVFGENPWFVDSGANNHITAEEGSLTVHSPFTGSGMISTSNGEGLKISHYCSSTKYLDNHAYVLNNVSLVPKSTQNLLSVHIFTSENKFSLNFTCDGFTFQYLSTRRILYKGYQSNGLYPLHFNYSLSSPTSSSPLAFSAAEVWHRWLGHPSFQSLQRINKSFALTNFQNKPLLYNDFQLSCSHKQPFQLSSIVSSTPLALLHMDLWGPCNVKSVDGSLYYAAIIDDFSKYFFLSSVTLRIFLYLL